MSGFRNKLSLRQFALHRLFHRHSRVTGSGNTHRLIYISTSGQRIADSAAETSSRAAKRFNFCRMIMCLILKVDQPFFGFSVNFHRHNNTAGVNLIRFFLICKFSIFFQLTHRHQGHIHQAYKFILPSGKYLRPMLHIHIISILHRFLVIAFLKINIFKFGLECCMTAVIGPICVKHTNLCHCWVPFFFTRIIFLNKFKIIKCHCKAKGVIKFPKLCFRHGHEIIKHSHIGRLFEFCDQSLRLSFSCFPGIHRINAESFNTFDFIFCHRTFQQIGCRRTDNRFLCFI